MSHADAVLPSQHIDAKRIVATSGAIAVHVVVLMMLMMPPEVSSPPAREVIIEPTWDKPRELPRITPPPPVKQPPREIRQVVTPQPVPVIEPPVEAVDTTPSVVDVPMPDVPPVANSFEVVAETAMFQPLTVVTGPAPPYPRMALQRGVQGTVHLRIHVDAGGKPIEVTVEQSSGSRILDEAAMKFVKARWRFVPAQSNGQAVEGWGVVPIEFVLE